ncbi:GYD domain-containing protein [Acidocella aromatica]|uniref:Uncharacterized protein with GYD domain n=1 Tax=Acidocella aromatica TaxID=1303579 RepID=A0A840V812_9PROT|nr:GYD domain-containing protein [Acidocella aromatica]MBB5371853.1 uncharacterized protein with GYD domain [Acidocella aromatica]
MQHFKFRWRYNAQSLQGIISYPENRTHLIKTLIEDFQGELLHFYTTMGEFHSFCIAKFPDSISAWACALASQATEGFDIYEVEPLLTNEEGKAAMEMEKNTHSAYFIYRSAIHPPATPGSDTESSPLL